MSISLLEKPLYETPMRAGQGPNRLDGLTILRFALARETGGGMETHLQELNRELGRRNRITTIQMQMSEVGEGLSETMDIVGSSRLVKVSMPTDGEPGAAISAHVSATSQRRGAIVGSMLNALVRTRSLNERFANLVGRLRPVPRRAVHVRDAGAKASALIREYGVNLVVLHSSGGADTSEVIDAARAAGVPVLLVHHFANALLGGTSVRQQTACVESVGGASKVDVPAYLKHNFHNLSDAVDVTFYDSKLARPVASRGTAPVLFAPGRITPEKGQMDVMQVASKLARRGLGFTVVFAGRVDDRAFEKQLRVAAAAPELAGRVVFAGQLNLEEYRDWLGAADITLMPTYHREGMPRTLIESQAMKAPPVVYGIGGTPEGVRDGETGFLLPLGNLDGMARCTERLLRDAVLRARMANAGRAFVEREFSLSAFAARHEAWYLEALNGHRTARR